MPPVLQSILTVAGGFVLSVVGVMPGTAIAMAVLLPKPAPGQPASPTATYLAANLLVSILAAALGGYPTDEIEAEPMSDYVNGDLAAAGIPYVTEGPDGPLYADFHALRPCTVSVR
jgi:hypothetical protein